MPSKKNKKTSASKGWSMFQDLHPNVNNLLAEDGLDFSFNEHDDENGLMNSYDTNIMGMFKCYTGDCSLGWTSMKIAITIRMYEGDKYNAKVWHQRCKSCKAACRPIVDDSYSERIAYRLRKWSGIAVEQPHYERKKHKKPHRRDLCEGCKAGHCAEGYIGR